MAKFCSCDLVVLATGDSPKVGKLEVLGGEMGKEAWLLTGR